MINDINQRSIFEDQINSYIKGFFSSLLLTVIPFFSVIEKVYFTSTFLIFICLLSAILQIFIHIKYFFHLHFSKKYIWIIMSFIFSLIVTCIIILGSMWIMWNLSHHLMS